VKTYWDSSAVINAAVSEAVMDRLDIGEHVTRLHALAEFFSIMTSRGILIQDATGTPARFRFGPQEAADWLKEFAGKVQFEELDKGELLEALDNAENLSVQGGRIYDYWHALVAKKAKVDTLLTRNTKDFTAYAGNVTWP
jgi:hypothetical protein